MDVLIVERDALMGAMLADTLAAEGLSATTVASDEEASRIPPEAAPQLVITGINRGHNEDMAGLKVVAALRRKEPRLCAVYLASLWPVRLRPEMLSLGERFLTKPVCPARLVLTVWELLDPGRSGPSGRARSAG